MAESTTRFALRVQTAMKSQQIVAIKDLAHLCDAKYESIRKAVVGDTIPSKHVMSEICNALKLPKDEVALLVAQDRIRESVGREAYALMARVKSGVEIINDVWDDLTPEHRLDLQRIAQMFARGDQYSKT